ncbi:MAG: hypothetical protein FJW32_04545 [Acidobacteria bacterium]|nr:hypothetical protein [Acidobacteriota bacterium]
MKNANIKKGSSKRQQVEVLPEYDFSGGVRGKYAEQYRLGTNVILLDPELAAAFPDSKSVNDTLKALLALANKGKQRAL